MIESVNLGFVMKAGRMKASNVKIGKVEQQLVAEGRVNRLHQVLHLQPLLVGQGEPRRVCGHFLLFRASLRIFFSYPSSYII